MSHQRARSLTRAVAREVGGDGICVNCIAPANDERRCQKQSRLLHDMLKGNMASRCIPREQMPEDLVALSVFAFIPESDFMTGQTVVIDGGSVMH